MSLNIQRIHHISSITGPVQATYDFYHKILGLRLVKQTVNFDDPSTYHLYFANQEVKEGTILTLFPWDSNQVGERGGGQGGRVAFAIPKDSLSWWKNHLDRQEVSYHEAELFGPVSIHLADNDGLEYALVEVDEVREDHSILGFYGMELLSKDFQGSRQGLVEDLGLKQIRANSQYLFFETLGHEKHQIILPKENYPLGRDGIGTVHHLAWSILKLEEMEALGDLLKGFGYRPTRIKDRKYFKSIYLREKGRILYEFASDGPGFTIDEDMDSLGKALQLPEHFEGQREQIQGQLKPLKL